MELFAMSESKPHLNIYLETSIVEMKHKDGRKRSLKHWNLLGLPAFSCLKIYGQ